VGYSDFIGIEAVLALSALCGATLAAAQDEPQASETPVVREETAVTTAESSFLGPAPARNFQPIQLVFLQLPFERARTVRYGAVSLELDSAESNEIATTQGPITSSLKFETNRTVFGIRYGFADRWEMGAHMPFISRYGGFMDPVIDEVEDWFNAENSERELYPENSFGALVVRKGDEVLFEGGKQTFQPGDLWFSVKREIDPGDAWPLLALRGALKVPTGDEDAVLGSGSPDLGFGVAAEKRMFRRLMLFLNVNLVFPFGRVGGGDLSLNPIVSQSFAAEFALTRRWSALLHQAVYTSPMHGTDTNLLDAEVVELGLGLNFGWSECLGFQLLGINNVSGVEQAADFTLLFGFRIRPTLS
jgi:hypothetical protein